jgi:hypothetical protein
MDEIKDIWNRKFSEEEIAEAVEIIKMFPNLKRTEIINTICENLKIISFSGRNRYYTCQSFLEKLEKEGKIKLPEKSRKGNIPIWSKIDENIEDGEQIRGELSIVAPIRIAMPSNHKEQALLRGYINKYHPLGYKNPFGSQLQYFILSSSGEKLGCILFASAAAWRLEARDTWIGWNEIERKKRLSLIINNVRYLIFPWVNIKNLASKALSIAIKQLKEDWFKKHGYEPVLLETFVDIKKYKGTCYKAANWTYIGNTTGTGRNGGREQLSSPKAIYMYPLNKDFRAYLKGDKAYKVVMSDD